MRRPARWSPRRPLRPPEARGVEPHLHVASRLVDEDLPAEAGDVALADSGVRHEERGADGGEQTHRPLRGEERQRERRESEKGGGISEVPRPGCASVHTWIVPWLPIPGPRRYDGAMLPAVAGFLLLLVAPPARAEGPLGFWDQPRKGANCQNRRVGPEYWKAAAAAGLEFVRLLPDAWPTRRRDFLMGSADRFTALDETDLATLLRALDDAHAAGVRVVLAPISLPGARWKQLNGDRDDGRLWRDAASRTRPRPSGASSRRRLRGHPALVAYNPLNEPHPERAFGFEDPADEGFPRWRARAEGTPADLDAFNRRIVAAIREADPDTPILLDGGFYASPEGLALLEPVEASAHPLRLPLLRPLGVHDLPREPGPVRLSRPHAAPAGGRRRWSADTLRERVARSCAGRARTASRPSGSWRRSSAWTAASAGALPYLADLVGVLDESGWHRAFYAFRGDGDWTGLDYELGFDRVDPRIWGAEKRGEDPERYKRRHDNPLWRALRGD